LLSSRFTRIPDLAPLAGDPAMTVYTAVNLELYSRTNPLGFLDGQWQEGQSLGSLGLQIINGQIPFLEGIYWATSPFEFASTETGPGFAPTGGASTLLNSATYPFDIVILQQHITGTPVPEPSSYAWAASGFLLCLMLYRWWAHKTKSGSLLS